MSFILDAITNDCGTVKISGTSVGWLIFPPNSLINIRGKQTKIYFEDKVVDDHLIPIDADRNFGYFFNQTTMDCYGWNIGDTLEWTVLDDSITFRKII